MNARPSSPLRVPAFTEGEAVSIALVGNPNSGKTSIFNALTGTHQRVGNYPGVTVERKEGHFSLEEQAFHVTDLPGTYSLSSHSLEERIARSHILQGGTRVVVDVVDAGNLERNLYLTTQLMELGANLVLVLNMADELRRSGLILDLDLLSERVGAPVVLTEGHRGKGVDELRRAILRAAEQPKVPPVIPLGDDIERSVARISAELGELGFRGLPPRAAAIRLLEGDDEVEEQLREQGGEELLERVRRERQRLEALLGEEPAVVIAERRYGWIAGLLKEVTLRAAVPDRADWTSTIDHLATHRLLGLPLFLGVMYGLFWLTFKLGDLPMGWIEAGFEWLGDELGTLLGPRAGLLGSLLVDGIVGGVGGVLVFLPNIVLLFTGLAFLEDTGYMARAAFLVDRVMHRVGLHGKSFIPMMVGFGCTVPAVMACRTLDSERDRLTTMLVLPLISCGARLPIYLLLVSAFFPESWRAPLLMGIYLLGILLAALLARLLRKTLLAGETTPFVMELPPYRIPTWKGMAWHVWQRSWMYLKKAGTVILGISVLMWAASTFPVKHDFEVDRQVAAGQQLSQEEVERARAVEALEYTLAGRVGHAMEPLIRPLGFDWRIGTAMIGALAAKEVFVSQLGIVFSIEEPASVEATEEEADELARSGWLRDALRRHYSPRVGLSLMIFALIASPCMATVAIVAKESGRWKWALLQWSSLTALAWVLSFAFNQLALLLGY